MRSDLSVSGYKQSIINNRCQKCILPDSYPDITFDERNICTKCRDHDKFHASPDYEKLEKKLDILMREIKSKKNEYDCVIGLSGGKDSSYMAYLCVEKYGLNPLGVTFDNGFLSKHAKDNIQKVVKKLKITHLTCENDWNTMKTLYRHFLLKTGEFCTPCNIAINSFLYKVALENNITSIISGYSPYTDAESNINIYHSSPEYFKNLARKCTDKKELNNFLYATTLKRIFYQITGMIEHIQLPRYLRWDEKVIVNILRQEFDWNRGTQGFIEHSDCIASPLKEFLRVQEFGFSEKSMKYSNLIRNNLINRDSALKKCAEFELDITKNRFEEINTILKLLDLTKKDLSTIIKQRQGPYIPFSARIYDKLINNEYIMEKFIYR